MAVFTVTNEDFVPEFGLPEGRDEILQNVACIICSRLGSMPMSRDIGLSQEWEGLPINVAQARIMAELAEAVSVQEPRARISEVECGAGEEAISDIKISTEVVILDGE